MIRLSNFINGELCPPRAGKYLKRVNPATTQDQLEIPDSDRNDIDSAVAAARAAFPAWAALTANQRADICDKIADLIEARLDHFARCESQDQGKPVWLAQEVDIPRACHNFRFFAGAVRHHTDSSSRLNSGLMSYVSRQPIGVAGLISPWNLPLYLLTWKIAPAIATGNTVVCKPSEMTSWTAFELAKILTEAGVPQGVVNIVFGTGPAAGQALVEHPDVPLISFTGGTKTGETIAKTTAPMLKRLSLELGGKNANIIFADGDFDLMLKTTLRSSFQNQGEICLCGSRIYVEESIYTKFTEAFSKQMASLKVGDPLDKDSFMGPLISSEHRDKVEGYLALAKKEGATVTGGRRPNLPGYFLEPAMVTGLKPDSRVLMEEIFGPVVTVTPFKAPDEVTHLANSTDYGLSASIWSRDMNKAISLAETLDAGTVWINTWMKRDLRMPFGGMKKSGLGREGQVESIDFYTEAKTICFDHSGGLHG